MPRPRPPSRFFYAQIFEVGKQVQKPGEQSRKHTPSEVPIVTPSSDHLTITVKLVDTT